MVSTVWHGTPDEAKELVSAIANNCGCAFGLMGVRLSTCPPHQAMTDDQRFMDGVLAYRHMRARLEAEEQNP